MGEPGKLEAAKGVVEEFEDALRSSRIIGIGTGSTVAKVVDSLYNKGLLDDKILVPSSLQAVELLVSRGLPVSTNLGGVIVDIYIDGADEVSPNGDMIKGRGAAMFGEKMLAYSSRLNIFVVDESKMVERLGVKKPLPLEVHPWSYRLVADLLRRRYGWEVRVRISNGKDGPVVSDHGNIVVDAFTGGLDDVDEVEGELKRTPGIVCTGLFVGLANYVVVGFDSGGYRVYRFGRRYGVGYP